MLDLKDIEGGCSLDVKVQPNAKKAGLLGLREGRVRIALVAPAVDGKANKALIAWASKMSGVSKSSIEILRGDKSREKTLFFNGISADELMGRLTKAGLNLTEFSEENS